MFGIYEQKNEWLEDSPVLRRTNISLLSSKFAQGNPYRQPDLVQPADVIQRYRRPALAIRLRFARVHEPAAHMRPLAS